MTRPEIDAQAQTRNVSGSVPSSLQRNESYVVWLTWPSVQLFGYVTEDQDHDSRPL